MKRDLKLVIAFASIIQLAGCVAAVIPERIVLESTARYGELVAHEEAQLAKSPKVTAAALYNLCYAYSKLKDYTKLFACVDRLEEHIKAGDTQVNLYTSIFSSDGSVTPYLFRAEAYVELSQYRLAITHAAEAYRLADRMTSSFMGVERNQHLIQALGLLALANTFAGEDRAARQHLKALEDLPLGFGGAAQTEPMKNRAIARVYMALGDFGKALEIFDKPDWGFARALASALSGTGENVFATLELPNDYMRGKCLLETGRLREAKDSLDKLLQNPRTRNVGEIYWLILYDRGRIAEMENNPRQAIDHYRKAADVIETQRASINTEAAKIGFVGDKQAVYQRLVANLFVDGQHAVAFEYIERSKARALVDMLASKQDFSVASGNAAQVRTLLAKVDAADAELRAQSETTDAKGTRSLAVQTRQQLYQQAPELASLVTVTPVTVQEIQGKLPADEVLVEYYAEGKEVYAFVLTKTGLRGIKLDGEGLTTDVQHFRQALQDTRSTYHRDLAGKLYNRLVRPLEGSLTQRNILIVAHGPLHYLPFNALHDGNSYLIERYSVRQLPSASVLKYLKGVKSQATGTLLAFGNPDLGDPRLDLKYAQAEAQNVAKVLPNSKALVRREASESAFKRYGEGFRYLHIASHGEFNADAPLNSALLLAKDKTNDGTLTVGELYSMRLNADLVTLSACETGLGKIANGDDVVGLTRGFLYAGSRSIVASLWKVDDEATAYLMTRFYGALKGTSKREALRLAQIETRKKYPHPYYWAAFQLTGEAS